MARVARYTDDLIEAYVAGGHWTPAYAVDFWRENASRHPERQAVWAPDGCFTWLESIQVIDHYAAALHADGWQRDEVLVLQAPNSAQLLFLRLACELAGVISALVPITFARAEVESLVASLRPRGVALPVGPRGESLRGHYGDVPLHYTLGQPGGPWPVGHLDATQRVSSAWRFAPYEYASVTTTSGTTGAPRWVEHAACARLSAGRQYVKRLRLDADDVICACTSIFSGNCDLLAYHAAPQAGSRIVLLDAFTPETFCDLVESQGITGAVFVPTLLHRLLDWSELSTRRLSSLRFVTSFGARLAPEVAEQVEQRLGVRLIQGYGASEYGALASTGYDDPLEVRLRGVGRPLEGTEVEIRDAQGQCLPVGSTGRIHARGPHCVGGFVHDEEATQTAWSTSFLAMGDLGRLDEQGYLWLEGRARDVIIRGGQNIAPLEIEGALLGHPAVQDIAVVGVPDPEMGERVCAFVVPANDAQPTLDELCSFMVKRGFAKFKLPERHVLIDALPMNPAGTKVNKRALQALLQAYGDLSTHPPPCEE